MSILICKTLLATGAGRDYEQAVILNVILGSLASLSLGLLLWQWLAARCFPLHARSNDHSFAPAVTVFKPLKGADAHTEKCLRSWFDQDYAGPIQILLGVHSAEDPACPVIQKLLAEFPNRDARLVITSAQLGSNGKVSNLAQLVRIAKHEVFVISDADVRVPGDFLLHAVVPLAEPQVGLVNCFYRLANPTTLAMQWEAIAINADFWSQVLQSKSLQPLDFALGAVMVTRKKNLAEIGGFESLADCLADDYQLGHRIARKGHRIELCPVVVECWHSPQAWREVWKHQLRWARTIRVCQPAPYFFSILSNATFWPLLWLALVPSPLAAGFFASSLLIRALLTENLQRRLTDKPTGVWPALAPVKDLLQFVIWLGAFAGNTIEWRGQRFQLRKDGTLVKL